VNVHWTGRFIESGGQVRRHGERASAATDAATDGTNQPHQPAHYHTYRRLHAHCVQPAGYIIHSTVRFTWICIAHIADVYAQVQYTAKSRTRTDCQQHGNYTTTELPPK